jgi:uncharacterized protein YPO0396
MTDTYSLVPRAVGATLLVEVTINDRVETITAGQAIGDLEAVFTELQSQKQARVTDLARGGDRATGLQFEVESLNERGKEVCRAIVFLAKQLADFYGVPG